MGELNPNLEEYGNTCTGNNCSVYWGDGDEREGEAMRKREVARFERAGDVRMVGVVEGGDGSLEVTESLSGPSALVAYGDEVHILRVTLSSDERRKLGRLIGETGRGSIEEYLGEEESSLVDLMDLCDVAGVAYGFVGMGEKSGLQFRPVF